MFKSAAFNLKEASKDQVEEFLNSFDTVLTDCDGVLWIENNAVPGSADVINYFRKIGKKIYYVTNNTSKTRREYADKAQELGFIASPEDIITPGYLLAHYLKSIGFKRKVYLIGCNAMAKELNAVEIKHIGVGPDHVNPDSMNSLDLDPEVGAVAVGFDEHISCPKLMKAASYLSSEDCLFITTYTNEIYRRPEWMNLPGAGTNVKTVLELCPSKNPLVISKPHAYVVKYLESYGLNPGRTLMIGDRCDTDIEFGVRCGFQTLLVLTGVVSEEELEKIRCEKREPLPDVVLPSLGDLLALAP